MKSTFEAKTKKSFIAVKNDVDEFKGSMNDWVIFLDGSLRDARQRIYALERKVAQLEEKQDLSWK